MDEPTSKKILFNKSTLMSLKAELLKKKEEVKEKKQLPQHKVDCFKPSPKISEQKETVSDKGNKKTFKERLTAVDVEELEACRKAKAILEKKAELYNHLADQAGDSQLAGRFLVDFKEKKQLDPPRRDIIQVEENQNKDSNEDDSDWVEFSDCLGRTRKCLKSDLELYKKRDKELMELMGMGEDISEEAKVENTLLVQKTKDYLQSLRDKWEDKERELLAKDGDIHYQDLLFDEARIHGVGYYAFSTNETERRKQMAALLKEREATLQAQKEAEEARKKRDELVAARVAAARARQRARAGLPPEDPSENQKDFTACLLEFLTQQRNEADNKAKEEQRKLKEQEEKERQKLREAYVREWDVGKEGLGEKNKKFKKMTQEEYEEQQRSKRIKEFAPVRSSTKDTKNTCTFDNSGKIIQEDNSEPETAKTWSDVRRTKHKSPSPPTIGDFSELEPKKGLYFSSKKAEAIVKYRNFVKHQEPTPIVNELSDEETDDSDRRECQKRYVISNHNEIAPPPTYEYYGPTPKKARAEKPFDSDIVEAYAQGTKSLETKSGNRQLSKNYDFTFD